jgi:hypothetical protein
MPIIVNFDSAPLENKNNLMARLTAWLEGDEGDVIDPGVASDSDAMQVDSIVQGIEQTRRLRGADNQIERKLENPMQEISWLPTLVSPTLSDSNHPDELPNLIEISDSGDDDEIDSDDPDLDLPNLLDSGGDDVVVTRAYYWWWCLGPRS